MIITVFGKSNRMNSAVQNPENSYLNLVNQICKLLNSSGDLMRNMNMVLIMLQDYLPIRNPALLIRDNVINKYFIDLAPEISDEEKNRWNQKAAKSPPVSSLKFQHEMILYPDEVDYLNLPCSNVIKKNMAATIIQPVIYQQQHLPLCLLSVMVTHSDQLSEVEKIIRFIADMLALSMIARGFPMVQVKDYLRDENNFPTIIDDFIGQSEKLKRLAEIVRKVSASKATVLIYGESGTGKELLAKSIHNHSLHRKAPFISVNCAALSENLLESELFGHERGAFTGATTTRKGRFELADGGTLFMDEIGDTSWGFQSKILRVLQEGQLERLGGNKSIHVDVRIVCATNVNLEQAVQNGTFREDLYYRLNVIRLEIPPLRERREDILVLADYFLDKLNQPSKTNVQIHPDDLDDLISLDWPGNVRELENIIHSAFLMQKNNRLNFQNRLDKRPDTRTVPVRNMANLKGVKTQNNSNHLESEEISAIKNALQSAGGVQVKAAKLLRISTRQLRYRIRKYEIAVRKIELPR